MRTTPVYLPYVALFAQASIRGTVLFLQHLDLKYHA